MEDTMFRDEEELVKAQIKDLLDLYFMHDIFELNELEDEDVIFYLYINGYIKLPEVQPL